ncbi:hypothetical protein AAMO2058_001525800 [Amorphochlora amoebiformis]
MAEDEELTVAFTRAEDGKHGVDDRFVAGSLLGGYISWIRAFLGEFLGSFLVAFICVGSAFVAAEVTSETLTLERILFTGLAYGGAFGCAFYSLAFVHIKTPTRSLNRGSSGDMNISLPITAALFLLEIPGVSSSYRSPGFPSDPGSNGGWIVLTKFSDMVYYIIAQAVGSLGGVYFAMLSVHNGFNLNPYATLDDVTTRMQWTTGILVCCTVIIVIAVVCYTSEAKKEILNHRLHSRPLKEGGPQSSHEVSSLVAAGTIMAGSMAAHAVAGVFLNPFFGIWTSVLTNRVFEPVLTYSPIAGSLCAVGLITIYRQIGVAKF